MWFLSYPWRSLSWPEALPFLLHKKDVDKLEFSVLKWRKLCFWHELKKIELSWKDYSSEAQVKWQNSLSGFIAAFESYFWDSGEPFPCTKWSLVRVRGVKTEAGHKQENRWTFEEYSDVMLWRTKRESLNSDHSFSSKRCRCTIWSSHAHSVYQFSNRTSEHIDKSASQILLIMFQSCTKERKVKRKQMNNTQGKLLQTKCETKWSQKRIFWNVSRRFQTHWNSDEITVVILNSN